MRPVFALLGVFAVASAMATHDCVPTTSAPEIDVAGFYVDNDLCQPCMWSIWVYQESNGIEGLQRGDEVVDDTCGGQIPADTIVF